MNNIEPINNNKYVENNLTFGDKMIDKDESITRILFQNVNGLEVTSHGHTLELICDSKITITFILNTFSV